MDSKDIEHVIESYKTRNSKKKKREIQQKVKDEISEEEAIQIYNEIITVLGNHNISYKCACNITLSLMYAFMTGAAELYDMESENS